MPPQRRRSSASAHAPVVPKVKLNDGTEMPVIGFGTGTALYGKESSELVFSALRHGYTYIDAAQMYGNSASIGDALKRANKRREDLYILTKFGQSGKSGSIEPRKVLIEQLEQLGVDYVDMFLIHSPFFAAPLGLKRTWEAMEALRDEGLCKSIGVSNFREEDLLELSESWKVAPAVNQIEFHPYNYHAANMVRLTDLCKKHNIVIEAYGPLTPLFRQKGGPVDSVVEKLAADKGATPAQILLAWARQKNDGVVVTTSRDGARQKEQLEAVIKVHLTDKEIESISEAGKGKFYRHFMGDVWEAAKP